MDKSEFDKFANEYEVHHKNSIGFSGDSTSFFAEYKIKEVFRLLKSTKDDFKILDFGGGIGNSPPYFKKYFPASNISLLDVSEKCLEIAKKRFPDLANFVWFDGQKIPFENECFDMVYASCVFHHIPENEQESKVKEIFRVLIKDGIFIVFEHNPFNPLTLKAVKDCIFDENAALIKPVKLSKFLNDTGFRTYKIRYTYFFPNFLRFLRFLEPLLFWLPIGGQYYIEARK